MQYNKFIQASFASIKKERAQELGVELIANAGKIPSEPQNLYIELAAKKNNQTIKIEQWNFKCLKTLVQSEYESNQDSQLDSVELIKKSYSSILQEALAKFNPKILIKTLDPQQLILSLVSSEKQLKPFTDDGIYLISIDDYEGNGFNCRITLQTIYTEMNRKKQHLDFQSSQEEFQVLIDSVYERQLKFQQQKLKKQQKSIQASQKKQKRQQKREEYLVSPKIKTQGNQYIDNKQVLNIQMSKYTTNQITITEFERKMEILNETIDLIEEMKSDGHTLRNFMRKLQ